MGRHRRRDEKSRRRRERVSDFDYRTLKFDSVSEHLQKLQSRATLFKKVYKLPINDESIAQRYKEKQEEGSYEYLRSSDNQNIGFIVDFENKVESLQRRLSVLKAEINSFLEYDLENIGKGDIHNSQYLNEQKDFLINYKDFLVEVKELTDRKFDDFDKSVHSFINDLLDKEENLKKEHKDLEDEKIEQSELIERLEGKKLQKILMISEIERINTELVKKNEQFNKEYEKKEIEIREVYDRLSLWTRHPMVTIMNQEVIYEYITKYFYGAKKKEEIRKKVDRLKDIQDKINVMKGEINRLIEDIHFNKQALNTCGVQRQKRAERSFVDCSPHIHDTYRQAIEDKSKEIVQKSNTLNIFKTTRDILFRDIEKEVTYNFEKNGEMLFIQKAGAESAMNKNKETIAMNNMAKEILGDDLKIIEDDLNRSSDKLQKINDKIIVVSDKLKENQEILGELEKLRVKSEGTERSYEKDIDDINNNIKLISDRLLRIEVELGNVNYTGEYIKKQLEDVNHDRDTKYIDSRPLTNQDSVGTYLNFSTTQLVSSLINTTFAPLLN